MNLHNARASYRRASQPDEAIPSDPHAIVGVALNELHTALRALSTAAAANLPLPSTPMTRTLAAIYLLQSSLDFDRGGDIAPALFRVYEYCRLETLSAFRRERDSADNAAGLARAAGFVATLADSWAKMDRAAIAAFSPANQIM
jgi:flagellar secretion chaperone FliS